MWCLGFRAEGFGVQGLGVEGVMVLRAWGFGFRVSGAWAWGLGVLGAHRVWGGYPHSSRLRLRDMCGSSGLNTYFPNTPDLPS